MRDIDGKGRGAEHQPVQVGQPALGDAHGDQGAQAVTQQNGRTAAGMCPVLQPVHGIGDQVFLVTQGGGVSAGAAVTAVGVRAHRPAPGGQPARQPVIPSGVLAQAVQQIDAGPGRRQPLCGLRVTGVPVIGVPATG